MRTVALAIGKPFDQTLYRLQLIGGGGAGAVPTIIGAFINEIIRFYCFRFDTRDVIFLDKVCLAIAIFGVISYLIFRDLPIISLIILTGAEIISFIPTFTPAPIPISLGCKLFILSH